MKWGVRKTSSKNTPKQKQTRRQKAKAKREAKVDALVAFNSKYKSLDFRNQQRANRILVSSFFYGNNGLITALAKNAKETILYEPIYREKGYI